MVSYAGNSEDFEKLGRLEFSNKKLLVFYLDDLLRASAEVLGRRHLGIAYKAALETGIVVAVKRLNYMNEVSKKEFLHQMQLLGNMKQENLVEVISFYYSEEQKLVIYELISDGTLFELLHVKIYKDTTFSAGELLAIALALAHAFALFAVVSGSMHVSGGHVNLAMIFGALLGGRISVVCAIYY